MSREWALGLIDRALYGVLATVDGDGGPYAAPLSVVREGEWIYFHCAKEGRKLDNLRRNPRASLVCVGGVHLPPDKFTAYYESAMIFGPAEEVLEEGEKIRALRLLCERYSPGNMEDFDRAIERSLALTGVWKIHIDEVSGKMNGL